MISSHEWMMNVNKKDAERASLKNNYWWMKKKEQFWKIEERNV